MLTEVTFLNGGEIVTEVTFLSGGWMVTVVTFLNGREIVYNAGDTQLNPQVATINLSTYVSSPINKNTATFNINRDHSCRTNSKNKAE